MKHVFATEQELSSLLEAAVIKVLDDKLKIPEQKPAQSNPQTNLVTRKELLKILKCSSTKLYNLMKDNKIPYKRIGRNVYFDLDQVMNSINTY